MGIRVRKSAPHFHGQAVFNSEFKEVTLDDYRGFYLVLIFYPNDFPLATCPIEIVEFSERAHEFMDIGCDLLGISTDSEFTHMAWVNTPEQSNGLGGKLNIALLSDKSMKISRDYGVLDKDTGVPFHGLFIIDQNGIIRHMIMSDPPVGLSINETLRLVKAFQATDKVASKICPVNITASEKTVELNRNDIQKSSHSTIDCTGVKSVWKNARIPRVKIRSQSVEVGSDANKDTAKMKQQKLLPTLDVGNLKKFHPDIRGYINREP